MKVSSIICIIFLLYSTAATLPNKKATKHAKVLAGKIAAKPVVTSETEAVHIVHPNREGFNFCSKEIQDNVKVFTNMFFKGDPSPDAIITKEEYLEIFPKAFNTGRKHPFAQRQFENWFNALDVFENGYLTQRAFSPLSAVAANFFDDAFMETGNPNRTP
jgi:hypothetical protein